MGALEEVRLPPRTEIFAEGAGGDMIGPRDGSVVGIIITLIILASIAVSVPYWRMLGLM